MYSVIDLMASLLASVYTGSESLEREAVAIRDERTSSSCPSSSEQGRCPRLRAKPILLWAETRKKRVIQKYIQFNMGKFFSIKARPLLLNEAQLFITSKYVYLAFTLQIDFGCSTALCISTLHYLYNNNNEIIIKQEMAAICTLKPCDSHMITTVVSLTEYFQCINSYLLNTHHY